jgi:hypothetical protein
MVQSNIRQRREELQSATGSNKDLIESDLIKWQAIEDKLANILASPLYFKKKPY